MAEAELVTKSYVNLKLTEDEAKWLKTVMQNPLHGETPNEEDATDKMHRGAIWRTLRVLPVKVTPCGNVPSNKDSL